MSSFQLIKKEIKHFFIYGLGNISQSALNFLLLPVYIGYFSPSQFGILSVLMAIINFSAMFASSGIMSAMQRVYFGVPETDRRSLLGTCITWYVVMGVFVCAGIGVFSTHLSTALFQKSDYAPEVLLIGIFFAVSFPLDIPLNVLRLEKKSGSYVFFSILRFVLDFSLKIILIIVLKRGVRGFIESSIISVSVVFISIFIYTRNFWRPSFKPEFFRQLIRLGLPFVFSGVAMWALSISDRLILNFFVGQSAVGVYDVGSKFSQLFNILLLMPFSLFLPAFILPYAEKHSAEDTKKLLSFIYSIQLILGSLLFIVISLGAKDLINIFVHDFNSKHDYLKSIDFVPALTIPAFLYFLMSINGYALLIVKKPEWNSMSAIIAAIVSVGCNFIFIPLLGVIGAVISAVVSYLVYFVLLNVFVHKYYQFSYNVKNTSLTFVFLAVVFFALYFVSFGNNWINLLFHEVTGIIAFTFAIWFFSGILTPDQKRRIISKAKSFFKPRAVDVTHS